MVNATGKPPFTCGQKVERNEAYGKVELRVDCSEKTYNSISVVEYKGQVQNGFQIDYDTLWRKTDSSFFLNGKQNGTGLYWDSVGNIVGLEPFRNGKHVGKRESYWSVGHPSAILNYNAAGQEDGHCQTWWKNGNIRTDYIAKNGQIISATEYYQNGKPRTRYVTVYEPKPKSVFKTQYLEGEAWAPNGKSTGKVVNGEGSWLLFPDGRDSTDKAVFREVYKNKILVKGDKLDAAEIAKWAAP